MIRILVPFNGSATSRTALAYARLIAPAEATVILAYVLPARDLLDNLGVGATARRETTALVTEAAATFPRGEVRLLKGDPAEAIAAEAARTNVDLIVFGSRVRSRLAGFVLGSTGGKLLQAATVPLMVVHEAVPAITTIVAGVESGVPAVIVARAAQVLAKATGARVALVNVVDADPAVVSTPDEFGIPSQVWRDALSKHVERVFGPLRLHAPGASETLRYGRAVDELPDAAEALAAQVIVVARRGSSGRDVDAWSSVAASLAVRGPFATLVV
jgi:nucleotide-binding universal stress UspA family protein